MTANLAPCPFCGSEAHTYSCHRSMHDKTIYCSCHCIDDELTPEQWNHRPFEEKAVEVLAKEINYRSMGEDRWHRDSEGYWMNDKDWDNKCIAEAKQLLGRK